MSKPEFASELQTFPMTYRIIAMCVDGDGPPSAEVIALATDRVTADRIVNVLNAYDHGSGEGFTYEKIPDGKAST